MDFADIVPGSTFTSGFGGRDSPGGIGSTNHRGIDLAAPFGTPIYAPMGGTVIHSGPAQGYGSNFVKVLGNDGLTYSYGHMSDMNVSKGMFIGAGTVIGKIGSEGNSTGNHLHLAVQNAKGAFLNPVSALQKVQGKGREVLNNALGSTAGNAISDLLLGEGELLKWGSAAAAGAISTVIPGSGMVLGALGIDGGQESWFDSFKRWILESGFFQRIALAILAFIVLLAAFYLMKEQD